LMSAILASRYLIVALNEGDTTVPGSNPAKEARKLLRPPQNARAERYWVVEVAAVVVAGWLSLAAWGDGWLYWEVGEASVGGEGRCNCGRRLLARLLIHVIARMQPLGV
jgi:hypothetical protein